MKQSSRFLLALLFASTVAAVGCESVFFFDRGKLVDAGEDAGEDADTEEPGPPDATTDAGNDASKDASDASDAQPDETDASDGAADGDAADGSDAQSDADAAG